MNHINRLLIEARKKIDGRIDWHIIGTTKYRPDLKKFTASGSIWASWDDPAGAVRFYSEHDTKAQACAAVDTLAEQYPRAETINFIIEDLTFPGECEND